jgi:hypothetical protein
MEAPELHIANPLREQRAANGELYLVSNSPRKS